MRIITVSLNPAIDRVIEVPNFTPGQHQVGRELHRVAAGKGINVAKVMAQLGVASIATGFLGDENRPIFTAALLAGGIGDEFLSLPGRTRENITLTDPANRQDTHIRDAGLAVGSRDIDALGRKLQGLLQRDAVVIFSGSIAPGMTTEDFGALIDLCQAGGAKVAVDTSGPALTAASARPLWLIKPNQEELAHLVGGQMIEKLLAAARGLAGRIGLILLTCERDGAYLVTARNAPPSAHRVLHARVELAQARVRNTVGCGDVFLGAFVAATAKGASPADALANAVACSAASACTSVTAQFDLDTLSELRANVTLADLPPA